ncbi:hypothetical protein C1646_772682 [Rhizophagus diaphanus]|nr:hypothetical protein C1646_772682 [Rhizophagus diaphanus] [Rhizophagus sp. MUCL 43196]
MDYNKEFEGRICGSCFEKKENNNRIELRIKKIMKICERAKVEITREEIIQEPFPPPGIPYQKFL